MDSSAPSYLKNLRSESVVQKVINCLTDAIISGELRPGDRIATEPELAEGMGVARSSVREATKILTYLGVLENRRSEGTFVSSGFQESMIDPMVYGILLNRTEDNRSLVELRQMMECGMLRLAIARRTEEGLALLREKVDAMDGIARKPGEQHVEEMFQADNAFHATICALCQNPIAAKINSVVQMLTESMRRETVRIMVVTGRAEELVEAHRRIYRVLEAGETEGLDQIIYDTYFLDALHPELSSDSSGAHTDTGTRTG